MTCLQGYIKATYQELQMAFGEATYTDPSADAKVRTEWEINSPYGPVTIYDWKESNAQVARSGDSYMWHVGGNNQMVVAWLQNEVGDELQCAYDRIAFRDSMEMSA